MRKPPLNERVMRGLRIIATNGAMVDVLNNSADLSEIGGSREDLADAKRASEWIDAMTSYRWHKARDLRERRTHA